MPTRSPHITMPPKRRLTVFDRWAAERLGVAPEDLTTEKVMRGIPPLRDLPDGPSSELGGQLPSELESPTESELRELAELGDELLARFPDNGEDDGGADDGASAGSSRTPG
jgi:hypothetical protein